MRIEITMQPVFWLSLTRHDVDILIKLSQHHYDSVCRMASKPGNFMYGWFNITRDQSEKPEDQKIEDLPKCRATGRELDTVLKICEGLRLAQSAKIITAEDVERINHLCQTVMSALEVATLATAATLLNPITEPTPKGKELWANSPGRM